MTNDKDNLKPAVPNPNLIVEVRKSENKPANVDKRLINIELKEKEGEDG